jgi:galactosylceramidase
MFHSLTASRVSQVTDDYIRLMKDGLYVAGFGDVKVVGGDTTYDRLDYLFHLKATSVSALDAVGVHYPCLQPSNQTTALGKPLWSTEDLNIEANWSGSGCWGRTINQNFVHGNITRTCSYFIYWFLFISQRVRVS